MSIGQALGDNKAGTIHFLCVDWTNGWLRFLSLSEVSRLAPVSVGGIKKSISVPHMMEEITLQQCLQHFTKEETLDVDNAWYCSVCKEHRQAKKTLKFWRLPNILIVGLKRCLMFYHS